MSHPNAHLVSRAYEAFDAGDLETLTQILDDNIVWHVPGRSPFAGDYRGRDDVIAYLSAGTRHFDRYALEVTAILANEDLAVVLGTTRASLAGREVENRFSQTIDIRGERIAEVWTHNEDQYEVDDFLSYAAGGAQV